MFSVYVGHSNLEQSIVREVWYLATRVGHKAMSVLQHTPAHMAMDFYCNAMEDKNSWGRALVTLPVLLVNEYHRFKECKKPST